MLWALCIGINNYPGTQNDLQGCINDMNDWAAALAQRGFTATKLADKSATRANILKEMERAVMASKRGDVVVITYSGHGTYIPDITGDEPDGVDECLCPYDIDTNGPIIDDEIYAIMKDRPYGVRLVFISDSCHSGSVSKFYIAPQAARRVKFMPPSVFMPEKALKGLAPVRKNFGKEYEHRFLSTIVEKVISPSVLMAGCQDTEYSYDANFNNRPNGAFTYFALKALKTNPSNYKAWMSKIKSWLPSTDYPQTPRLSGVNQKWNVLG